MTISTLDGMLAGFQPPRFFNKAVSGLLVGGRPHSYWGVAGIPGAGSFDTTLNGVTLTSSTTQVSGQIPFSNPAGGQSTYLARFAACATQSATTYLLDRLWHNGGIGITLTSAQVIASPAWPARDINGATSGAGILLGLEVSAVTGANAPTITVSYTNSSGSSARSAVNIRTTSSGSIAGAFYPLSLQSGDAGAQSVQSVTLSASWTSGTVNLVAFKVLSQVECPVALIANSVDAITGGFPTLQLGTVPYVAILPNTTTTSNIFGNIIYSVG